MKKLIFQIAKRPVNASWPLLVLCFLSGYLAATILFYFFGHALRASLHGLSF